MSTIAMTISYVESSIAIWEVRHVSGAVGAVFLPTDIPLLVAAFSSFKEALDWTNHLNQLPKQTGYNGSYHVFKVVPMLEYVED
jgi:hypothetical protein